MSLKSGLMIAAVLVGLGATSVAMAPAQEGTLPPDKAKKESKEWSKEHAKEAKVHRAEAKQRGREAKAHRLQSHEAGVHRQPRMDTNMKRAERQELAKERKANAKLLRAEHKREAKANRQ